MTIDFNEAAGLLKESENVLILTHRNPDGDTLGSGFALLRALKNMGKRVKLINADPIPQKFAFLNEGIGEDDFEEDFVVSVDVAERKLLGIVQSGRTDVSAMNYVIPIKMISAFLEEAKAKENIEF